MEAKRMNIDLLYRQKEMQLEPLPFSAWEAMNERLHGKAAEEHKPLEVLPKGSANNMLMAIAILVLSVALYLFLHHRAQTSLVPKETSATSIATTTTTNTTESHFSSTNSTNKETTTSPQPKETNNKKTTLPATLKQDSSIATSTPKKQTLKTTSVNDSTTKKALTTKEAPAETVKEKRVANNKKQSANHHEEKASEEKVVAKEVATVAKKKETVKDEPKAKEKTFAGGMKEEKAKEVKGKKEQILPEPKQEEKTEQPIAAKEKQSIKEPETKAATSSQETEVKEDAKAPVLPMPFMAPFMATTDWTSAMLLEANKMSLVKNFLFDNKIKGTENKVAWKGFKNMSVGVKAGYELGTSSNAVNKTVFAGYLQYQLSEHASLVLQPAIRMGNAAGYNVGNNASYYQLTGTTLDTMVIVIDSIPENAAIVTQHYDSIGVKRTTNKGSNMQLELLLLAKYQLDKHFCVTAGVGFNKGALPYATESKANYGSFQQIDTFHSPSSNPVIDTSHSFIHSSMNFSQYTAYNGATQSTNPLRISYFASVEYWYKRWMIELAITQELTTLNSLNDKNLQNSYQQPYIRIMAGWRLGK